MRFAAHHVPPPPRRRFWLGVVLVLLLLVVPLALFNLAVDPFDFRLAPHLTLIREPIMLPTDTMLWAASEIRRIPKAAMEKVTIAVVGDSRAETITRWPGSPRVFKLGDDYVISLSLGGASLFDSVKLLGDVLPRLPNLRGVVLAMPIERVGFGDLDRAANALRLADTPPLYVLSLGTLASAVELLNAQADGRSQGWSHAGRPEIDPAHIQDPGAAALEVAGNAALAGKSLPLSPIEQSATEKWRSNILKIDPARLAKRANDTLFPLVERLRKKGIRIVFFFPPLNPRVYTGVETTIAGLQRPYVEELKRYGRVENFSMTMPDGLVPVFVDSMHVQQDFGHAIMAEIYRRDFAKPPTSP